MGIREFGILMTRPAATHGVPSWARRSQGRSAGPSPEAPRPLVCGPKPLPSPLTSDHDHPYKRLFSHPEMVADLIRGFCPEIAEGFDETSLQRVNSSYVSDDWRDREDDVVWTLRWRETPLTVARPTGRKCVDRSQRGRATCSFTKGLRPLGLPHDGQCAPPDGVAPLCALPRSNGILPVG